MTNTMDLLNLSGITKVFPGMKALDSVDFSLRKGEVHILVGENGAGKSTLVKVISALHRPEEGSMEYRGRDYSPTHPREAMEAGIRVIYQELSLIGSLSVAENIFFERLPRRRGLLDRTELHRNALPLLEEVGLDVPPGLPVRNLGIAQQQQVEIAKALSGHGELIIMDEPTATLTSRETEKLFEIIRRLKQSGKTVLYISHRLKEIFEIGDRVTVMRNGRIVKTSPMEGMSVESLVSLMVGRELGRTIPFREDVVPGKGEPLLRVENLRRPGQGRATEFSLYPGEILGIAGLVGSGRTEMIRSLYGLDRRETGRFFIRGREVRLRSPREAVAAGIGFLTEDRKDEGLLIPLSCSLNLTITDLKEISRRGFLSGSRERQAAGHLIRDLKIKAGSPSQPAGTLSGGNQQKIVIGKWLFRECEILIFDEPTRGIDVGAKQEIYHLLWDLAARGKGLIVISSEIEELTGLCHRLLVCSRNEFSGEFSRKEFDQEAILAASYANYL